MASRQWRDLRDELSGRYGAERAAVMVCALTRDDPVNDCKGRAELAGELHDGRGRSSGTGVVVFVVLLGVGVLVAGAALLFRARRARRVD